MENGGNAYRRYLDGDDGGMTEIIRLYKDGLIFYINGFVRDILTAEELTEETFFRLAVKKPKFSGKSSFKTWLYTVGRNAAPANGEFGFSIPLRSAMEEYGDSVLYRVVIDVFKGKKQLASDNSIVKAEEERLSAKGYTVAVENYYDGSENHYRFTLHAEYDELKNFAASEDYGYFISLYDERTE